MLIIAMPFAIVGTKFSEAAAAVAEEDLDSLLEEDTVEGSHSFRAMPSLHSRPTTSLSFVHSESIENQLKSLLDKLREQVADTHDLKREIAKLQSLRDNLWTSVEHSMAVLAFEGTISFSSQMIEGPWIKTAQAKRRIPEEFKYTEKSLGIFHKSYLVRRLAIAIASHWVFEMFVLLLIIANSFTLAVQNYYPGQEKHWGNVLQEESENWFTGIFAVECAIKIVAYGFVAHPKAYLRDPWNWVDFVVVVAGILSLWIPAFSFLKSVRVIRPLRSLSAVPGIRHLFSTIILSLPGLKDVVLLALFLLVMFGVLGLQIWSGMLHRSCRLTSQPLHFSPNALNTSCKGWCFDNQTMVNVTLSDNQVSLVDSTHVFDSFCRTKKECLNAWESGQEYYMWPLDTNQERFCGQYQCVSFSASTLGDEDSAKIDALQALGSKDLNGDELKTYCGSAFDSDPEYSPKVANAELVGIDLNDWFTEVDGESRNFGITNFDNVGVAFLVVFQCVTLEGWSDIMQMVQDATSDIFGFVYFMFLILIGSFFLINVILAIIWDAFCDVEEKLKKRKAEEEFELHRETLRQRQCQEDQGRVRRSSLRQSGVQAAGFAKSILWSLVFNRDKTDSNEILSQRSGYCIVNLARKIASHSFFNVGVMSLIIINVVVLSMDTYPQSLLDATLATVLNYIFNFAFVIEFIILHLSIGPLVYWSDNAMAFDGVIVIISTYEIISDLLSSSSGDTSALSALRAFRMLRIFKLAKKFPSMKILLRAGMTTLLSMGDFVALLLLVICVLALVAQSFFGGRFMFDLDDSSLVPKEDIAAKCPMGDGDKPICVPRAHFDTFLWSFITIFQMLTGENWNTVMYDGMRSSGWAYFFFFLFVIIFGNFIILNLFLAILMTNFDNQRNQLTSEPEIDAPMMQESPDSASGSGVDGKGEGAKKAWQEAADAPGLGTSGDKLGDKVAASSPLGIVPDGSSGQIDEAEKPSSRKFKEEEYFGTRSCFVFSDDNAVRRACKQLVQNPRFDHTIMVLIGMSSLMMALENPLQDQNGTLSTVLEVISGCFTAVFFVELVIKMIAMGVLCGHGDEPAYLRSFENALDFVIVLVSLIDTVQTWALPDGGGGVISVFKIFRVVRMLRPLRLISRNKNLKIVIKTILSSLPELRDLLLFSSLFFLIFGLLGVSNYKGGFYSCKDSSLEDYSFDGNVQARPGINVTSMCIPDAGVLLPGRPPDESLRFMQQQASNTSCETGWQSWSRPTTDTPVCEVHCDADKAGKHPFCQNSTVPWGYHVMRCSDCKDAFCSDDESSRSDCQSRCSDHEYFCKKAKTDSEKSECREQCEAACMCEGSCREQMEDAALCVEQGGKWVNMNQNFNNLLVATISLVEICTTEGWVDVMLAAVDSRGPYLQPKRDHNEVTGTLTFVAFMLIGSFFVLNLCVGVIIDNYNKQKEEMAYVLVTDTQAEWMAYQKALYIKKTFFVQVNVDALGPSRQHRFRIITSAAFENFIMVCIVMNTILLSMVWQPRATGALQEWMDACNLFFVIVFHLECLLKLSALHWNYFREYWNVFDFFCIATSDIVNVVEAAASSSPSNVKLAFLVSALRIFRIARLFRLVRFLKGLNKLILAFVLSVPKLMNVGLLMLLLLYLYAVLGMSLFAKVAYTGTGIYGPTTNFRTFYRSMVLLIRSMTGEGFNEIMHDLSKGDFYYQSILDIKCEVPMKLQGDFSTHDLDNDGLVDNPTECGTVLAYVYFISYTVFVSFVILNLFIAVIFEGFEESSTNETKDVINKCVENWQRYDPYNTMNIRLTKALDFIDETVGELLLDSGKGKGEMQETRWDPKSTTDMNASDALWSMYNLQYVRTLGLKIKPDGNVRFVQAVKAVIRRVLVAGGPDRVPLPTADRRRRALDMEALEAMMNEPDADEEVAELKKMENKQGTHIESFLRRDYMSTKNILLRGTMMLGNSILAEPALDGDISVALREFSMLEKVAAAKIQRRAKESMQRRRAKDADADVKSAAFGPINRAAG
eukprot:TRINITY_DN3254_c0_g2_i1.p1 TRINITY_DN3254_c0_g2~~TRINITY_DN3254_c0_g2_i1.p1  ORF type:complete len:2356 (-),score=376.43 TRINITY_DN3254_c0_g2_i1:34-6066(-)